MIRRNHQTGGESLDQLRWASFRTGVRSPKGGAADIIGMEADMSTGTSDASSRVQGPSHWDQLNDVLGEWWQHLRSRNELESLDASMLRDIGSSRGEAGFEASKRIFWTPAERSGPDCASQHTPPASSC
jgi:uncharacterized protein YjiS (DUF1127 family)